MAPRDVWIHIEAGWENSTSEWERTRYMAYIIHLHAQTKRKIPTIEQFLPLASDKEKYESASERIRKYKEQLKLKQNAN